MVVPEKQQCAEEQKRAEAIGLTPDGGIDDDGGAEKIGKRDKECAFSPSFLRASTQSAAAQAMSDKMGASFIMSV